MVVVLLSLDFGSVIVSDSFDDVFDSVACVCCCVFVVFDFFVDGVIGLFMVCFSLTVGETFVVGVCVCDCDCE